MSLVDVLLGFSFLGRAGRRRLDARAATGPPAR
jgi:hypothetical protein